jgi:hypothetical protein
MVGKECSTSDVRTRSFDAAFGLLPFTSQPEYPNLLSTFTQLPIHLKLVAPFILLYLASSHDHNVRPIARGRQTLNQPPNHRSLLLEALLPREHLQPTLRLQHPGAASSRRSSQWSKLYPPNVTCSICRASPTTSRDLHLAIMHTTRALTASHRCSSIITP